MIARLKGELIEQRSSQLVVDCGGVGYAVSVSGFSLGQLPKVGEHVTLWIYTQATENRLALYGFATDRERSVFDLLITVKNVGPSSAIAILSGGLSPEEIAAMIAQENTTALTKIKGIGKKTAEMVIVELRDKCQLLLATWGASGDGPGKLSRRSPNRSPMAQDIVTALVQLGWRQNEAENVVDDLTIPPGAELESMIREALQAMSR